MEEERGDRGDIMVEERGERGERGECSSGYMEWIGERGDNGRGER